MTTVSKILENLEKEDSTKLSNLEKSLRLTKKLDRDKLGIAIKALTKLGIIESHDNDRFSINHEVDFIQGRVRCSSKGYCFVAREDQGEDIYIREENINNAWHGDSVIVLITKPALKRRAPEGSIKCVLKRYNDKLLAKIELDKTTGDLKAYPLDDRIPAIIEVNNDTNITDIESNDDLIYEIEISKYPIAQFNAQASIIRELSINSGLDGDIEILLSKNNIYKKNDTPRVSPKKINPKGREDFTSQPSLLFQSWECSNAPNLPALFAQPHKGGYRMWLHSPAVSERLNLGSKLDLFLKDKAEVICLGNNWLEFLNSSLESASKFKLNEETESLSLIVDIDSKGNVIDWRFSLSLIKPVKIINTKHLQAINKRNPTSKSIPISLKPIKDNLETIHTILYLSKLINQNNLSSIKLDQHIPLLERLSELQKTFPSRDFHGWSKSSDFSDPQSLIDIFVRLSNNILAKHLIGYKLPFIYKEHEDIDPSSINEISKSALNLDNTIPINLDGSCSTKELIDSFQQSAEKKILHKLVKHLIPGIHLKLYKYNKTEEDSNLLSQINIESIESPWCCPSLNYWNIFNQYIICTLLCDGKNKLSSRSKETIELGKKDSWKDIKWDVFSTKVNDIIDNHSNLRLVQHLNEKRKQSKSFRNNIISLAQGREAEKIIGKDVSAIITGVQSYGFFAEIEDITAEGLVHVSTLGDDWYEYRSRQNLLIGRKNKKTYQLAQQVNVRVLKVDILKNQIDLELIKNEDDDEVKRIKNTNNIKANIQD